MVLDLAMGAMVNLNFMAWNSLMAILQHVMSFASLVAISYLSYFLISILVNLEIKKRDKVESTHVKTKFKRWLFLRVPIKENAKLLPSFTPENYIVHDILICVFLVLFNGIAIVQITLLILMKGYIFGCLLTFPMKELPEQLLLMGNEFFFLGILVQFLRIEISSTLKKDHGALQKTGKVLIILYICMLAFNAAIALMAVLKSLKEMCSKKNKAVEEKESGLSKIIVKRRDRLQKKYIKMAQES